MKPRADGSYSTEPSLNPPEPPDTVECPICEGEKILAGKDCGFCRGTGDVVAKKEREDY